MNLGTTGRRERVLDPGERLAEILFGLIMVLTFTGSISVATADRDEVRGVLVGALGCNLAWGIIDGIMYLMAVLFERNRGLVVARAVRASADAQAGRALIAASLPEVLADHLEEAELEHLRGKLAALPEPPRSAGLTRADLRGALGVFLLVFLSTLPVVLPFLFVHPLHRAMRVSNGVALALLFVSGRLYARHTGLRPNVTGLVWTGLGVVLVALTIALGG